MQKITSILLQGSVFHIEDSAYKVLESYLKSIRKYFTKYPDTDEIVADIESRIAEKFTTEILTPTHQTITDADVDQLISSMGTIAQITESADDEDPSDIESTNVINESEPSSPKRLFRDTDHAIIAGVASGLAAYLHVSPTIIRLLFVASLILGGWGIFVYIIMWLLVPEAKTPTQKIEMSGNSITLATLEKNLQESIDRIKPNRGIIRQIAQMISSLTGNIFRFIGIISKPLIRISGGITSFFLTFAFIGLSIAAILLSLNFHHQYLDEPSQEFLTTLPRSHQHIFIWSAYVTAFVPLIIIFLITLSIAMWRNMLRLPVLLSCAAIWIIATVSLGVEAIHNGPTLQAKAEEINRRLERQEISNLVTKSFPVKEFTDLKIQGHSQVYLQTGDKFSITSEGLSEQMDTLSITQKDTILTINTEPKFHQQNRICFFRCSHRPVTVTITAPDFKHVTVSDFSRLMNVEDTTLKISRLEINTNGSSNTTLAVNIDELSLQLNDFSAIDIKGKTTRLEANVHDNTELQLQDSQTSIATITTTDFASVDIAIDKSLNITARDMSQVVYYGTPKDLTVESDDMATIRPRYSTETEENNEIPLIPSLTPIPSLTRQPTRQPLPLSPTPTSQAI